MTIESSPKAELQRHAQKAATAFLAGPRRDRMTALLEAPTDKQWDKFRRSLAGTFQAALDPRHARPLSAHEQHPEVLEHLLRQAGAPDRCAVVTDLGGDDGLYALTAALGRFPWHGQGVLISCVPGALAYYESEGADRFILLRAGAVAGR
ncbi:hypothetical protein ABZ930_08065 [Streptomyces sp. NPDC046716]|uniref:hypothetical protein n=1 Tax=Streptomyces sp. NPDC046716 TaxID=3157093 RepID=UPI0033C669F6